MNKQLKTSSPIPPRESRSFGLPPASELLGADPIVAWLGVELDTDCVECLLAIKEQVGRGTALAPATPVVFEAIPSVFGQLGLYKIQIRVRSPYIVAGAEAVEEQLLELTESANRQEFQLFLPDNGRAGPASVPVPAEGGEGDG